MIGKEFTLEEAESLIPQLEPIVRSLMESKRSATELGEKLASLQLESRRTGGKGVDPSALMNTQTEIEFLIQIINDGLEAIETMGVLPKDIDIGLVDFPSTLNGESVLLCWRYGETSIDYYHGQTEGFSGRKPLNRSLLPGGKK